MADPQNGRLARLVQGGGLPYIANANSDLREYLVDLERPAADQATGWWLKIRRLWLTERPFTLNDLQFWH